MKKDTNISEESRRTCNHRCIDKTSCGHLCCKTGVNLPKKSKIEIFFDQLHNKMNSFPSKKVKIDAESVERVSNKIEEFSTFNEHTVQAEGQQTSKFGEEDTMNEEWNDYMEDCFTPAFDEMSEINANKADVWSEAICINEREPMDKETLLRNKISFDLNFDDAKDVRWVTETHNSKNKIETINCNNNTLTHKFSSEKQKAATDATFKREVWSNEKIYDPKAWEELYQKVINHLTNY